MGDAGYDIEEYFEGHYENEMDCPRSYRIPYQPTPYSDLPASSRRELFRTFTIDPLRVEIGKSRLIADMLQGFWRFVVNDTA